MEGGTFNNSSNSTTNETQVLNDIISNYRQNAPNINNKNIQNMLNRHNKKFQNIFEGLGSVSSNENLKSQANSVQGANANF